LAWQNIPEITLEQLGTSYKNQRLRLTKSARLFKSLDFAKSITTTVVSLVQSTWNNLRALKELLQKTTAPVDEVGEALKSLDFAKSITTTVVSVAKYT
jgi:hypothetical protein